MARFAIAAICALATRAGAIGFAGSREVNACAGYA
jgi:hypothetical protein